MKYEDMSDFDLNRLMAAKLGIEFPAKPKEPYSSISGNVIVNNGCDGRDSKPYFPDYCADWNSVMPIYEANEIQCHSYDFEDDTWWSVRASLKIVAYDKSLLRAIVICLIKVMEAKGGE